MIPIRLQWERPADGVELSFDPDIAAIQLEGDGRVARMRSPRVVPVTYEVANLENPIVLHFINCKDDNDRIAFLSRFGLLRWEQSGPVKHALMPGIEYEQERLTEGLILSTSNLYPTPTGEANYVMNESGFGVLLRPSFEMSGPDGSLRLLLHPDSLSSFMAMEVAFAHETGAVTTTCEHCGRFFLTGPLTGRRSHAKFCSDRCRVAAMRKRNAAKGGEKGRVIHVDPKAQMD